MTDPQSKSSDAMKHCMICEKRINKWKKKALWYNYRPYHEQCFVKKRQTANADYSRFF